MIQEHDRVVLTRDLPGEDLVGGDVGTFVHVYADGKSLEIEFMTLDGQTAAVATLIVDLLADGLTRPPTSRFPRRILTPVFGSQRREAAQSSHFRPDTRANSLELDVTSVARCRRA